MGSATSGRDHSYKSKSMSKTLLPEVAIERTSLAAGDFDYSGVAKFNPYGWFEKTYGFLVDAMCSETLQRVNMNHVDDPRWVLMLKGGKSFCSYVVNTDMDSFDWDLTFYHTIESLFNKKEQGKMKIDLSDPLYRIVWDVTNEFANICAEIIKNRFRGLFENISIEFCSQLLRIIKDKISPEMNAFRRYAVRIVRLNSFKTFIKSLNNDKLSEAFKSLDDKTTFSDFSDAACEFIFANREKIFSPANLELRAGLRPSASKSVHVFNVAVVLKTSPEDLDTISVITLFEITTHYIVDKLLMKNKQVIKPEMNIIKLWKDAMRERFVLLGHVMCRYAQVIPRDDLRKEVGRLIHDPNYAKKDKALTRLNFLSGVRNNAAIFSRLLSTDVVDRRLGMSIEGVLARDHVQIKPIYIHAPNDIAGAVIPKVAMNNAMTLGNKFKEIAKRTNTKDFSCEFVDTFLALVRNISPLSGELSGNVFAEMYNGMREVFNSFNKQKIMAMTMIMNLQRFTEIFDDVPLDKSIFGWLSGLHNQNIRPVSDCMCECEIEGAMIHSDRSYLIGISMPIVIYINKIVWNGAIRNEMMESVIGGMGRNWQSPWTVLGRNSTLHVDYVGFTELRRNCSANSSFRLLNMRGEDEANPDFSDILLDVDEGQVPANSMYTHPAYLLVCTLTNEESAFMHSVEFAAEEKKEIKGGYHQKVLDLDALKSIEYQICLAMPRRAIAQNSASSDLACAGLLSCLFSWKVFIVIAIIVLIVLIFYLYRNSTQKCCSKIKKQ